jgi:hypothetical protein
MDDDLPLDSLPALPAKRGFDAQRADADVERERLSKRGQSSTLYFPWGRTFESTYTYDYQAGDAYRRVGLVPGF